MKKLFLIISFAIFFSCSNDSTDDNSNSSGGLIKWKFKVNGTLYEWVGDYPYSQISGQSSYLGQPSTNPTLSFASPIISAGNRQVSLTLSFPTETVGNFTINSSSNSNTGALVLNGTNLYSTYPQLGQINLQVSQIASAVGNITKGTFSGTMISSTQQMQTIQITEGSFEAIRIQ